MVKNAAFETTMFDTEDEIVSFMTNVGSSGLSYPLACVENFSDKHSLLILKQTEENF